MRLLILALLFGFTSQAAKPTDVPGNPKAPVGGTYYTNLKNEPESLNPINSTDAYSSIVDSYVMEGLLTMNPNTYEMEPGIAEKWEESKDGLTYTFTIREGVTFSDGKPLTVEDIKFSFESVKDPAFKAAHRLPYYEEIQ
jgi:ABC-type transport system substrate-binding protein